MRRASRQSRPVGLRALPHRRIASTIVLAAALAGGIACSGSNAPTVKLRSGDGKTIEFQVEIARTAEQLRRGLMWREELPRNHGMLFVFPDEARRSFWMKNTIVALDIIYIGGDGRIVSIAENTTPYSTTSIPSKGPARYVLEVAAGTCRRHGIEAGSLAELPELATAPAQAP